MGRSIRGILLWMSLPALVLVCFSRLVFAPGALLVDPTRPAVDLAVPGHARGIGNDLTGVFLPRFVMIVDHLRTHGTLPLWDDSGFGGRPLVGNPQAGLFYPPVWLTWISGDPSALGWLTVAHLAWAGLGAFLLAKRLRMSAFAACVVGGSFEASPYLLAHVFEGHYPHIWSVAWYPWAFLALVDARKGGTLGMVGLPVVLALSLLAGHVQEWYYLIVALGAWMGFEGIRSFRNGDRKTGMAWLLLWAGMLALALALCGAELLPDIAAQPWGLSKTDSVGTRRIDRYHLHALNLFQLLSPSALGGPHDYIGHDNYWETVFSAGIIPLILAGIGAAKHPDRPVARGWMILGAFTAVFAAGRKLGVYAVAYAILPGMNHFRVPSRTLFLTSLAVSILAGMGTDVLLGTDRLQWLTLRRRIVGGLALIAGGMLGLSLVGSTGNESSFGGGSAEVQALRAIAADPAFWSVVTGSFVAWYGFGTGASGRVRTAYFLGALAFLELGLNGRRLLLTAPVETFLTHEAAARRLSNRANEPSGPLRVASVGTVSSDLEAARFHIQKTNVNDSFQIQHAADLYERLYPILEASPPIRSYEMPMDAAIERFTAMVQQSVLDRMSVGDLVSDREPPFEGMISRSLDESLGCYPNPNPLPRSFVVAHATVIDEDPKTIASKLMDIDPRSQVALAVDPLADLPGPRQSFKPATWLGNDPGTIRIRVDTDAPGYLVVGETWMPGWSARVDGAESTVARGNHWQQVVPLRSAGSHDVVLTFQPPGLRAGIGLTAIASAIWGLMAVGLIVRAFAFRQVLGLARISASLSASNCPRPHWLPSVALISRLSTLAEPSLVRRSDSST